MITCIFGLTACGSEETYTDYEQRKMDTAIQIATQYVIPSLENFEDEATLELSLIHILRELLFSLMLESHNDTAVVLGEYIGGKLLGETGEISEHTGEESKAALHRLSLIHIWLYTVVCRLCHWYR